MKLLAAELLKARTTRAPYTIAIGLLLIAELAVIGVVGSDSLDSDARSLSLMDAVESASVFAIVLGILFVTNEYRHATIASTFLVTPRRERVLAAKLAAGGIVGAALGALAAAIALAIALPWLSGRDEALPIDGDLVAATARCVLAFALAAALGTAVGALVTSQVGAIVGTFAWFILVEPILVGVVSVTVDSDHNPIAPYLPGAVFDSVVSTDGENVLRFAPGTGLALLYVVGVMALATALTIRRDIA